MHPIARLVVAALFTAGLAGPAFATCKPLGPGGFPKWLQGLKKEAAGMGISERGLAALDHISYDKRVIDRDRSQSTFSLTFMQFQAKLIPQSRLSKFPRGRRSAAGPEPSASTSGLRALPRLAPRTMASAGAVSTSPAWARVATTSTVTMLECSSQVVAAVSAATILFVVTIVPWWASTKATLGGFWRRAADQGVFTRYADFSKGVIDTGNLVFFVATTIVFLFLTVKVLESRRWK